MGTIVKPSPVQRDAIARAVQAGADANWTVDLDNLVPHTIGLMTSRGWITLVDGGQFRLTPDGAWAADYIGAGDAIQRADTLASSADARRTVTIVAQAAAAGITATVDKYRPTMVTVEADTLGMLLSAYLASRTPVAAC